MCKQKNRKLSFLLNSVDIKINITTGGQYGQGGAGFGDRWTKARWIEAWGTETMAD